MSSGAAGSRDMTRGRSLTQSSLSPLAEAAAEAEEEDTKAGNVAAEEARRHCQPRRQLKTKAAQAIVGAVRDAPATYAVRGGGHFMSDCPMRQQFHGFRAQQLATAGASLVRNHVVTTTSVEPQGGVSLDLPERRIFVFGSRSTPCNCNAGHCSLA
jgi:hypothetical protein